MATTVEKEVARAYHALVKAGNKCTMSYTQECQDGITVARMATEVALSKVVAEQRQKGGEAK